MNKDLLLMDDNCGAVSDEHGNIRIVTTDSDKYSLESVLEKENEVENIVKKIDKLVDYRDQSAFLGLMMITALLCCALTCSLFGFDFFPTLLYFYIPAKIICISDGIKNNGILKSGLIGRIVTLFENRKKMKQLNLELDKLRNELSDLKINTRFVGYKDESNEVIIEANKRLGRNIGNCKVLKLTRNKNKGDK